MDNKIFVCGDHNSGKTTVVEALIRFLKESGVHDIATIKNITHESFKMDIEGKDTWRHARAGASIVCARALQETDFLLGYQMELDEIVHQLNADIIIIEGMREMTGKKILVAKNMQEYRDLIASLGQADEVIAIAGPIVDGGEYHDTYPFMNKGTCPKDVQDVLTILAKNGRLKRHRLKMPLESLGCSLDIDGEHISMKPYVQTTLKNLIIGSIASLYWNIKSKAETISLSINFSDINSLHGNELKITVNEKILHMKEFVKDSIISVIFSYVKNLNMPGNKDFNEIKEIAISIRE
ncbi:MAG: molybdopterin-guanine dinucleotide biosynthesis protein B [Promethearchaeota archaeon]